MASTRARLTVSYAIVLLGTMVVFAVSVWAGRREISTRDQLAQEIFRSADKVLASIQTAQLEGKRLTYVDTAVTGSPVIRATKELGDVLDPLPGWFIVLDQQGRSLYSSTLIRS